MSAQDVRDGYFADFQVERLLDLVLQMTAELTASSQRQHALEILLARHGVIEPGAVDGFIPDASEQRELDGVRDAVLSRWLRVLTESGTHASPLRPEWFEALGAPMP